ncbi:MAG: carboxypeptidase regulatory-like domain-containing protein, partial [Acidobacteria bacterium]|nr:carboxypeptidase regulatory-like domain-containing protein [Acidobacteriota bacterium]
MKSLLLALLLSFVVVSAAVDTSYGQTTTGRIVGTVRDESGAMIPGVEITVRNPATGFVRNVTTGEQGSYNVPLLPPAVYEVEAELAGFRKEIRRGITVQVDAVLTIDFDLKVGIVTEVLDVTADAPLIESETATLGQVMDFKKVTELPLNQRHFMALTTLTAGVQPSVEGSNLSNQNLSFHAMGAREVDNNFLFDGVDNNDTGNAQLVLVPSIDAIQEFKIQSSTYGAEFGRAAGAVVNIVTKAGTNDFHVTAFEFLRRDRFDARNFFASRKQPYERDQYGVVVSGPLVKDRTFWLVNYEANRVEQTQTSLATVPSAAIRNGDFSSLSTTIRDPRTGQAFPGNRIPSTRFSSIGKAIADFYPAPNREGANNYETSAPNIQETDIITVRMDHRFSDNHSIYGRFSWQDAYMESPEFQAGVQLPKFGAVFFQPIGRNVALNDTYVISSNMVNEARIGFNRLIGGIYETLYGQDLAKQVGITGVQSQLNPRGATNCTKDNRCKTGSNLGFPRADVSGYSRQVGTYSPQLRYGNTWHYFDMLAITKGTHQIKTGAEYRAMSMNLYFDNIPNGSFTFDGRYSGNAMADLLLGLPASTSRFVGDGRAYQRSKAASVFFQDDWKVTPELTLNLGMRWEVQTAPISAGAPVTLNQSEFNDLSAFDRNTGQVVVGGKSGMQSYRDPLNPGGVIQVLGGLDAGIPRGLYHNDYNDFAPRFGFAWSPEKLGIVVRGGYGVFYVPVISAATWTHRGLAYPFVIPQTFVGSATSPSLTLENPFPGGPGAIIVRAVDKDVRTGYLQQFNLGIQRQLGSQMVLDVSYAGSKGTKLTNTPDINQARLGPGTVASRRLYPQWGSILERQNSGASTYHALQSRFERRFSNGLTFINSYTWSHSIDDGSGSSGIAGGGYQNSLDLSKERGDSVYDVRHRLVFSYSYELPFG